MLAPWIADWEIFARMNHLVYFGSKANEDPQKFVDEIHKTLSPMGANEKDKA